jgi:hypothetical protein
MVQRTATKIKRKSETAKRIGWKFLSGKKILAEKDTKGHGLSYM